VVERLCFVLCVESGPLEALTVRAVESLRLFGGRFADAPVLAVTPRRGAPLSQRTRHRFGALGVEHVWLSSRRRFSWYHYLNKPAALAAAEELAGTELIGFLDSDTLVLKEPSALELEPGLDFSASISDITLGATTGPDHPNEPAWTAICELVGIRPDDLPWVEASLDRVQMRLYFNSGVLVYRRSTHVGTRQLELLTRAFRERVRLPGSDSRMVEQVVLSPLVVSAGIPWKALPFTHNSTMISLIDYDPANLRDARILHYHDSMAPEHWTEFLGRMKVEHPEVGQWLHEEGPITSPAPPAARAVAELFRVSRGVRRRASSASDRLAERIRPAQKERRARSL
jgi:hypothetical protein